MIVLMWCMFLLIMLLLLSNLCFYNVCLQTCNFSLVLHSKLLIRSMDLLFAHICHERTEPIGLSKLTLITFLFLLVVFVIFTIP